MQAVQCVNHEFPDYRTVSAINGQVNNSLKYATRPNTRCADP